MGNLEYTKSEPVRLGQVGLSESWVEDLIDKDPAILGLGEVIVAERQRRQERAGRLDLLLQDTDANTRYEVELMLGPTDESHVIRCIEYWDIERRRYPGHEHVAVLVAEDITSRFLNLISLFAGTIPLIAMQLRALKLDGKILVDFVPVINRTSLRTDDETDPPGPESDRNTWNLRCPRTMGMADDLIATIRQVAPEFDLKYNKWYLGLRDGVRSRNFIYFEPKKQHMKVLAKVEDRQAWQAKMDEAGLDTRTSYDWLCVTLTPEEYMANRPIVSEWPKQAVKEYQAD